VNLGCVAERYLPRKIPPAYHYSLMPGREMWLIFCLFPEERGFLIILNLLSFKLTVFFPNISDDSVFSSILRLLSHSVLFNLNLSLNRCDHPLTSLQLRPKLGRVEG